MGTIIWFSVNPDEEMREAAGKILTSLDAAQVSYEWLGKGRLIEGRFCVSIRFDDPTWSSAPGNRASQHLHHLLTISFLSKLLDYAAITLIWRALAAISHERFDHLIVFSKCSVNSAISDRLLHTTKTILGQLWQIWERNVGRETEARSSHEKLAYYFYSEINLFYSLTPVYIARAAANSRPPRASVI